MADDFDGNPYYLAFYMQLAFCSILLTLRVGGILRSSYSRPTIQDKSNPSKRGGYLLNIPNFAFAYFPVFCLVSLAEWLQGSYVYALYKSYGYDIRMIALLFIAGFLSSAVSGIYLALKYY